jgi:spermidine synthase
MNVGEPSTASLNRFYTVEFFQQCYQSLNDKGIFAFSFPSSTEYLADELKDLNASIYQTFRRVFTNTLIVPGTLAVIIGTTSTASLISQPDSLAKRYVTAGISAEYFSKYMFEELMPPDRIKFITNTLETAKNVRINTDNNPVTYFFDLLLWNRFLQGDNQFFSFITRFWIFVAGGVGSGLMLLLIFSQQKQKQTILFVIISICGMSGMALNLLFLLNFQETFGSIYEMVGAMIAANMLGLALGTLVALWLSRKYDQKTLLLVVLTTLIGVMLLLPKLLDFLLLAHFIPITLVVTVFSGGLIGIIFGIMNRFYLYHSLNVGSIYAFDVFGSSIGALITCSVLLPVLGIRDLTLFLVLLLMPVVLVTLFLRKQAL